MLAPWKKSYDQTKQHIKSRDITLPTKVHIVRAMVFPVIMYGSECWTIKKAECQRIDAFYLWCWRGLLRVPWTARRSNQSILKDINPEYSLEGLKLKLKFQYFGHLMWRNRFTGEDPDAGKDWGQEDKEVTEDKMVGWHHWCDGCEFSKLWEIVKDREGRTTPAIFTEWAALIHRALQKDYLVRKLSSWNLGSSISGATRRDRKVKERENKAPGMLQFLGL